MAGITPDQLKTLIETEVKTIKDKQDAMVKTLEEIKNKVESICNKMNGSNNGGILVGMPAMGMPRAISPFSPPMLVGVNGGKIGGGKKGSKKSSKKGSKKSSKRKGSKKH
jgi:hypothetical protein